MTTSEHADLWGDPKPYRSTNMYGMGSARYPTEIAVFNAGHKYFKHDPRTREQFEEDEKGKPAALAPTPSPAQPTEANRNELIAHIGLVIDGEMEGGSEGYKDNVKGSLADAILAAGFRLAPSPVQDADDRLAQAEAVIAEIVNNGDTEDSGYHAYRLALAYQQSPQAALNEVRAVLVKLHGYRISGHWRGEDYDDGFNTALEASSELVEALLRPASNEKETKERLARAALEDIELAYENMHLSPSEFRKVVADALAEYQKVAPNEVPE